MLLGDMSRESDDFDIWLGHGYITASNSSGSHQFEQAGVFTRISVFDDPVHASFINAHLYQYLPGHPNLTLCLQVLQVSPSGPVPGRAAYMPLTPAYLPGNDLLNGDL